MQNEGVPWLKKETHTLISHSRTREQSMKDKEKQRALIEITDFFVKSDDMPIRKFLKINIKEKLQG